MMNPASMARHLAARFGLRQSGRAWRGDCPLCGYGGALSVMACDDRPRPRLDCFNGCDWRALTAEAERALGDDWAPTITVVRSELGHVSPRMRAAALQTFEGAASIKPNDPAGLYLAWRRAAPDPSPVLRYRADCTHPDYRTEGPRFLGMVALVQGAAGRLWPAIAPISHRRGAKRHWPPPGPASVA